MNRIVKILLVILAALIIAGAGFWSGTRYGASQAAAVPALVARTGPAVNAAPAGQTPADSAPSNQPRPGFNFNRQRDGQTDPNKSGDARSADRGRFQFNNSRSAVTSREMPPFGMMMDRRPATGFQDMGMKPFGSMFLRGGMMLFGLLFILGFITLMVLGIIVLFRTVRKPAGTPAADTAVCAKCGGSIQSNWKHCPHCGTPIK